VDDKEATIVPRSTPYETANINESQNERGNEQTVEAGILLLRRV
jgi:hypothetical protein